MEEKKKTETCPYCKEEVLPNTLNYAFHYEASCMDNE